MPNTRRVDATLGAPLLPPTQDPWYTAPQGFEWARPGTVLRIRQAPGNITSQLGGNCTAAYNLLYRTTDGLYKPSWAVTTIFVPATTTAALPSYQIWMDSSALDASPSYLLSLDEGAKFHADITDSLSRGWFFNVPDYEGPLAAFGNGIQAGHAVLDSIRATFNAARDIGLSTTAMHAMWGYSGGSLASNWAAELAEQYAPEMRFSGVALGGLVPNGTSLMRTINGGPYPGLIASCLMGSAAQVPEFKAWLDSRLKTTGPHNATGLYKANNLTVLGATNEYANQDIGDYFIGGQVDVYGPEVTAFNNRFALWGYHGVPRMPTYVYKAIKDEISVVADADAVVQRYCQGTCSLDSRLLSRSTIVRGLKG